MKIQSLLPNGSTKKKYTKYLILALASIFIIIGIYQFLLPFDLKLKLQKNLISETKDTFSNIISETGFKQDKTLPEFKIHVKKENWDILSIKRKEALNNWVPGLSRQVMIKTPDDWVGCKIETPDDKKWDAKMRLKGRLNDHWGSDDRWSFNIRVKDNQTYLGMQDFSIQHPKTRGYVVEWLFHQLLKKSNLIALRYGFCYVSINGSPKQIYAFEEGLEKRLIENNQLREGPILKLNTDYNWFYGNLNKINLSNTGIEVYNDKDIQSSEVQKNLADLALAKIDAFRNKSNKTSETFDSKKWASFFAILDWLGHDHAGHYDNARFYFNPITTLIEPIGRDFQTLLPRNERPLLGEYKISGNNLTENWFECFFQDKQFMKDYLTALEQTSHWDFKQTQFTAIRNDFEKEYYRLKALDNATGPDLNSITELLENNRKVIFNKLHQNRKRVFAYINQSGDSIELSTHNADSLPMILDKITSNGQILFEWIEKPWLEANQKDKFPVYQQFKIENVTREKLLHENTVLHIKYPGTNISFIEPLLAHPSGNPVLSLDKTKIKPTFNDFSFLKIELDKNEIHIMSGNHILEKPLVIPEGFRVVADLPLTIDLIKHAFIHSRSPIFLTGTPESPIKIISSDKSGGILILNTSIESQLHYVNFENLNTIVNQNLNLTGAITFYEAAVIFKNCQFLQNHCEDYLNIFRSNFQLIQCKFEKSYGDAFDGDFVKGKIEECNFNNSSNDAMDISGSHITVLLTTISGAGDKGLSIGEKSILNGHKLVLENCEIGIAVKDSSEATLTEITLNRSNLGITAYQKKSEFSSASIKIGNLIMKEVKVPFLREKNSIISVDEKLIPATDQKIKDLLYGNEFGKKSQ